MKTLKILLVALLFISLSATVVMASDAINEAEATFKREMGSGVIYGMESSQPYIIDEWRARIRDLGNGVVEIHGYTRANQIANYIDVTVILQQKINGKWVDIHSQKYVNYYSNSVSGTKSVSVAKGSFYRVRTVHKATNNVREDTTTAVTPEIYVN
ncbi:MAG: hypothetical protein KGZ94_11730 [Clostridia bacterium]|nr:hypothetical protein [Clostridia bacterium]